MIFVGAKYLHTRDIGKLKKYVCMIFCGGGGTWGGTENLWGGGTPPPPPPRSYAPDVWVCKRARLHARVKLCSLDPLGPSLPKKIAPFQAVV